MACSDYYKIILEYNISENKNIFLCEKDNNQYIVYYEVEEYAMLDVKEFSLLVDALNYFQQLCENAYKKETKKINDILMKINEIKIKL